jgi:hypothetical protein
MGENTRGKDIG